MMLAREAPTGSLSQPPLRGSAPGIEPRLSRDRKGGCATEKDGGRRLEGADRRATRPPGPVGEAAPASDHHALQRSWQREKAEGVREATELIEKITLGDPLDGRNTDFFINHREKE
jgi:hypothetical protein